MSALDSQGIGTGGRNAAIAALSDAAAIEVTCMRPRCDFAVELEYLIAAGANATDPRWLLCIRMIELAIETTPAGAKHRTFRKVKSLAIPRGSCFILTANGERCTSSQSFSTTASSATKSIRPHWDARSHILTVGD